MLQVLCTKGPQWFAAVNTSSSHSIMYVKSAFITRLIALTRVVLHCVKWQTCPVVSILGSISTQSAAVLCCAVLCCAVLCCAVLCCADLSCLQMANEISSSWS